MQFITSFHAIENYLKHNSSSHSIFFFKKETSKVKRLLNIVKEYNLKISRVDDKTFEQFGVYSDYALKVPNESDYCTISLLKQEIKKINFFKNITVLIIDGITDPHNIGAILRSCALFSVDLVIYPKRNSSKINTDTVHRVSTGANNIVKHYQISNISQAIQVLKENEFWIFGVDVNGESISHKQKYPNKVAFIVGSEGSGISKLILKKCDNTIRISSKLQSISCLNVSVATGIILHQRYIETTK